MTQDKEQELQQILIEALENAYNFGRADSKYIPKEAVVPLVKKLERLGYKSPEQLKTEGWNETSETEEMKHIRQTETDTHDSYGGLK